MSIKPIRTITSEQDSIVTYLQKVWEYKSLILSFTKMDIKAKYAQTFLGVTWTLLQPISGLLIFTFFFEYILKNQTFSVPFPVFAFIGFSAWNFWSNILNQGSTAIFDRRELLSKVYFPKIILPLSKVLTSSFDFFISLSLLIILIPAFKLNFSFKIILLPFVYFLQIIFSFSCSVILAIISLRKRDFFHIIPYVMNFGIWLTPVFYQINLFPEKWKFFFYINPIALCVEGYRWCIFEFYTIDEKLFYYNIPIIAILFIFAITLINKNENQFVERI
jgi:lipopolysaccharide transport system permease protein